MDTIILPCIRDVIIPTWYSGIAIRIPGIGIGIEGIGRYRYSRAYRATQNRGEGVISSRGVSQSLRQERRRPLISQELEAGWRNMFVRMNLSLKYYQKHFFLSKEHKLFKSRGVVAPQAPLFTPLPVLVSIGIGQYWYCSVLLLVGIGITCYWYWVLALA